MTNGGQAQKKAEKPIEVPKEFKKLINEFNSTLTAIKKAKSDKEATKHLQKLVDMYDKLFDYIFMHEDGKAHITALLFNEFWKIPKFQEYLDKCAGGISAFAYGSKTGEQKEFDDLFWFVNGNQANLTKALTEASKKTQETAVKIIIKYLTEFIPYSNKEFAEELGPLKDLSADNIKPQKDGKLIGKLNREIVFASLLYFRRYYAVVEGGKKNKDIAVFEVKPKIKTVPKKPLPMASKKAPPKKKKEKKKPLTKEKKIKKKMFELNEEIEAWNQLLEEYCLKYGVYAGAKDISADEKIMKLRYMHASGFKASQELLKLGQSIIEKIYELDDMIADADLTLELMGTKAYDNIFFIHGNALRSTVEVVLERLGKKEPDPDLEKSQWKWLQDEFDKYQAEVQANEVPTISVMEGPLPTPAEQAEIDAMLTNPSKAICAQYGPPLCGPGEYVSTEKEKQETMEMLILMTPLVGPVYSLTKTTMRIKDKADLIKEANKTEKYLKENITEMSAAEIIFWEEQIKGMREAAGNWKDWATEGALVVVDLAFLGLDITFIGGFVVKTATRGIGRDALILMEKEVAAGKLVTTIEKQFMEKALLELNEAELQHLFRLVKDKGGMRNVITDMMEFAGKTEEKEITLDVMRRYLEFNPLPTGFKAGWKKTKEVTGEIIELQEGLSLFSKKKFQKQIVVRFYKELVPHMDFGVLKKLSKSMAGLSKADQKYAVDIIFQTAMSFDKAPSKFLLKGIQEGKFTWSELIDLVKAEEKALLNEGVKAAEGDTVRRMATRNVLLEELPSYKVAYKKAPYTHWAQLGIFMAGVHVGFIPLIKAIESKLEKDWKEAEDMLSRLTSSDEAMEVMDMFGTSMGAAGGM